LSIKRHFPDVYAPRIRVHAKRWLLVRSIVMCETTTVHIPDKIIKRVGASRLGALNLYPGCRHFALLDLHRQIKSDIL
jgi:hypothetical protein